MRIALIGDVHANLPALEAVLAHAEENGTEEIWNIGDFIGYGAFPEEVICRLRDAGAISIQGNYDRKVLKVKKKREKWVKEKTPEKWLAFQWAYEHISKESRRYLRQLPIQKRFKIKNTRILLVHGSPDSQDEHLTPQTPDERLSELAATAQADIVVCGHSHQPFTCYIGRTWFVNTGSVGRPDDGDPRAAYAILDLQPVSVVITHYRVDYDLERAVQAIRENQLPEDFARMIRSGRDLKTVQNIRGENENSISIDEPASSSESGKI